MAYVGATPARIPLTSSDLADSIVTAAKIATDAVETAKVKDLNVSTAKLAADAVTNAKTEFTPGLEIKGDGSSAAGKLTLNCEQNTHAVHIESPAHSAGAGYTLTLPTGVGTDGQVLATDGTTSNQLTWVDAQETKPTITSSSLGPIPTSTPTSVTIVGTNFVSVPLVQAVSSTGALTTASVVAYTSSTSINATFSLVSGDYYVRIENNDGNAVRSSTAILQSSDAPTWTTASGSLGSVSAGGSVSFTVVATSDSDVTYTSNVGSGGTFPGGVTLAAATGVISGTETGSSALTTYTFDITATDAEAQTAVREFTITITQYTGSTGGAQWN